MGKGFIGQNQSGQNCRLVKNEIVQNDLLGKMKVCKIVDWEKWNWAKWFIGQNESGQKIEQHASLGTTKVGKIVD